MDTISFKIVGAEKFKVDEKAYFVPDFSVRDFASLSENERMIAKNKRLHYVRHFILHADPGFERYFPKVEIFEKANFANSTLYYELVVTGSMPKALFENNLQELSAMNCQHLPEALSSRLYSMGVQVSTISIASASLSVLHLCTNIILPPEIKFRSLIKELSVVDVGKAYDTTSEVRKKDKNNSEILHLFCGTREWAFYEKVQDLKRSGRHVFDKLKTDLEKNLAISYNLDHIEIFRYEYRLKKARTIQHEVNKTLGRPHDTPVIFSDMFSEELWQKILLNSWRKIINRPENQLALIRCDENLDLLLYMLAKAKTKEKSGHSQNQALWSYGLTMAIKDHGAKAVRQEVGKIWSDKATGTRFDEKLKIAVSLADGIPLSDGVSFISKALGHFQITNLKLFDKRI